MPALTGPGAEQSAHHVEPGVDNVAPLGRQGNVRVLGPAAPADVRCIHMTS